MGDTSLMLRLGIPSESGPAPKRAIEFARTAVSRLPESVEVPPERVEGSCADIDRELAGEVLGEPVSGARGVVAGGDVSCSLRGERAGLDVSTTSDPELMVQLEDMRAWAEQRKPNQAELALLRNVVDAVG